MTTLEELRIADVTTEQLAHILASRRAVENAEPPPALEWENRERTVEERVFAFAQWCRSIGVDEDMIGRDLYQKLRRFGYAEGDALQVLHDGGVTWRFRTPEEQLVDVAAGMLDDGWDEPKVRWAIRGLTS